MTRDRMNKGDDAFLDALFDAARDADAPAVSAGLQARLMADAAALQPRVAAAPSLWQRIRQALADVGGLPGLASVSAAGVAGLWIGIAPPASAEALVSGLTAGVLFDSAEADFLPMAGTDLYSVITTDLE